MDNSQSFTARRSATTSLPNFQLPSPDHLSSKYSSYAPPLQIPQSNSQGIGSVLTPPVGVAGEGISPVSSGVNSGSGSSLNGVPERYNPQGFWPPPNHATSQYSFSSGPPMPSPYAQNSNTFYSPARGLYSPSTTNYNGPQRSANSSSAEENLPQPPYQLSLPSFSTGAPSGGQGSTHLPNLVQQQQQGQQSQPSQQNPQQQQPPPSQQQQQQNMQNSPEHYGPRPPPTPTYSYGSSSTPQQSTFPAFSQPSPTQQSPITSGGPNRISPISGNHPNTMQPPPGSSNLYRPYNGYNLPGLSGQLMQNNIHNPSGQMMVGQMPMQGYPHPGMQAHQMYGMNPGPGPTHPSDKPCKCDQCPTSFNRNHDLKRHKRIHMTIKPFPCEDCEKRFSRKDALKRHILVKGCGKSGSKNNSSATERAQQEKGGAGSDTTSETPSTVKKEGSTNDESAKF